MPGSRGSDQLGLALDHTERFGREDFLEGPSNAAGLALVDCWPDWGDTMAALVGPEGAGKSHLAAIWAAKSHAPIVRAATLVGANVPGLLSTGAVGIEDLAPGGFDETVLFHLLNLARQQRVFVLLTARTPPARWAVGIKDLASRLRAVPAVALAAPDDALLRAVIVKLWADRQIPVDDGLVSYLANHIERSFAAARAAVTALDREALRQQRPVTRALAAEMFRGRGQPDLFGEG